MNPHAACNLLLHMWGQSGNAGHSRNVNQTLLRFLHLLIQITKRKDAAMTAYMLWNQLTARQHATAAVTGTLLLLLLLQPRQLPHQLLSS